MKKMKEGHVILILSLVLCLVASSGCGMISDMQLFKSSENGNQEQSAQPLTEDPVTVVEGELDITEEETQELPPEAKESTSGAVEGATRQVVLYFATADGSSLEGEVRNISQQEGIARATVNQLIAGPQSEDLYPTLPAATILEDINIREGICTVDFSSELLNHMSSDDKAQLLAVYSIVNTLTQFDTVDYVQILVDGQTVTGGLGGIDLTTTLAPVSL